jgi:hypothetical protein
MDLGTIQITGQLHPKKIKKLAADNKLNMRLFSYTGVYISISISNATI